MRKEKFDLQRQADRATPKDGRHSTMGYLLILFAAAFVLLLLAFFMQHRDNQLTLSELSSSITAFDSIDQLLENNESLSAQVDTLENQVSDLEGQLAAQEHQQAEALALLGETQASQLEAMDWFWRIQREVSRGYYNTARTLIEDFQATALEDDLPQVSPADPDGPSPAAQYQEILDLLY